MDGDVLEAVDLLDVLQQLQRIDGIASAKRHPVGEQHHRPHPGDLERRLQRPVGGGESLRIEVVDELEGSSLLGGGRLHHLQAHLIDTLVKGDEAEAEISRQLPHHPLQFLLNTSQSHAGIGQLIVTATLLATVDRGSASPLPGGAGIGFRILLLHRDAGVEDEDDLLADQFLPEELGRIHLHSGALEDQLRGVDLLAIPQFILVALPQ